MVHTKTVFSRKRLFIERNPEDVIMFAWSLGAKQVQELFQKKVGVGINSIEDAQALVRLVKSGNDKAGALKDKSGNPIKFDALAILNELNIPQSQIQDAIRNKKILMGD